MLAVIIFLSETRKNALSLSVAYYEIHAMPLFAAVSALYISFLMGSHARKTEHRFHLRR